MPSKSVELLPLFASGHSEWEVMVNRTKLYEVLQHRTYPLLLQVNQWPPQGIADLNSGPYFATVG